MMRSSSKWFACWSVLVLLFIGLGWLAPARAQEENANDQNKTPATAPATTAPTTARAAIVVTPPAKDHFELYLLMGQSNMVGRDTRKMDAHVDNPRILVLADDGRWIVARDPLHHPPGGIAPGVGPGLSFADEMVKRDPNVTIGLIPCAVGGTPLRRWMKDGDLYKAAIEQAKVAAKFGQIKGVLWHQGEADTGKEATATTYGQRLTKMFEDLRSDLGAPNLPIVVGQLGPFLDGKKHPFLNDVREALRRMPTTMPSVGYADSEKLTDKGDKLHFSTESQREMGHRYAEAMKKLQHIPLSH